MNFRRGRGFRPWGVSLGGANEWVMDTVSEEEGHTIRIQAPHQGPDPQRCSVRRDDLQPHDAPGPEPRAGHDFRAMVADVQDLAGIAVGPRFDHHGPRDPGPRMPASIPRLEVDHRLTPGNSRARITMPWRRVLRDEASHNCQIAALVLLRCRDTVSGGQHPNRVQDAFVRSAAISGRILLVYALGVALHRRTGSEAR
jgi:hypothetical protein